MLRKQRYAKGWNDWSVERVDFSYRGHPDNGWIPADWKKSIVGPDGTISVASTDTVTEFRINQPIPHAEFKVELPATEYVEDKDSQADREAKAEKRPRPSSSSVGEAGGEKTENTTHLRSAIRCPGGC